MQVLLCFTYHCAIFLVYCVSRCVNKITLALIIIINVFERGEVETTFRGNWKQTPLIQTKAWFWICFWFAYWRRKCCSKLLLRREWKIQTYDMINDSNHIYFFNFKISFQNQILVSLRTLTHDDASQCCNSLMFTRCIRDAQ